VQEAGPGGRDVRSMQTRARGLHSMCTCSHVLCFLVLIVWFSVYLCRLVGFGWSREASRFEACVCAAGYKMETELKRCSLCDAGFFCPGDNVAYACSSSSSMQVGARSASECMCENGRYREGERGQCAECAQDEWCREGERHACPAGSSTLNGTGASSEEECVCNAGRVRVTQADLSVQCEVCPAWHVCDGSAEMQACSALKACWNAGEFLRECSATADAHCETCESVPENGEGVVGGGECAWGCRSGFFWDAVNSVCAECLTNATCGVGKRRRCCSCECEECEAVRGGEFSVDGGCLFTCTDGYVECGETACCMETSEVCVAGVCVCLPGTYFNFLRGVLAPSQAGTEPLTLSSGLLLFLFFVVCVRVWQGGS
jgi:hypothetical protein